MNRRLTIRVSLLACTLMTLAACSGSSAGPEPCDVPGIPNCTRLGDIVFGGQPTREALVRLAEDGFRTVVSNRGPRELNWDEAALADSLGLDFVAIPMAYPLVGITDTHVARLDSVLTHAGRPLLLHCSSGNRTSGLWAVWLAEREGVPVEEAFQMGRQAGMTRVAPLVKKRLDAAYQRAP